MRPMPLAINKLFQPESGSQRANHEHPVKRLGLGEIRGHNTLTQQASQPCSDAAVGIEGH
jgi:hypothetical protein